MSIKNFTMFVLAMAVLVAAGCKDKSSEVACVDGKCSPRIGQKQVVDVQAPAFKRIPQLSQNDEPVNQKFAPIHESQIANQDLMSLAGNEGHFNDIQIDEVEIPGVGHTEAAIAGDREYAQRNYRENLWPGGVKQGAEVDFETF